MSDNKKFNFKLFARLLNYVLPYKINFAFLSVAAILISVFSILNQYLLKEAVDKYITPKDYEGLIFIISVMLGVLLFQVTFQFLFVCLCFLLFLSRLYFLLLCSSCAVWRLRLCPRRCSTAGLSQ